MALLYILTGNKEDDKLIENLDLAYMTEAVYGDRIKQTKNGTPEHYQLKNSDRHIHVVAHGNRHSIADQDGEAFAKRLLDTFGKDQLRDRTVFVYSCQVAEGGGGSVLDVVTRTLHGKHVRKTLLIGSVDQTFTKSSGKMMVLKEGANADKLSRAVDDKGGHARDEAAKDYLRDFRDGWRGYKIRDDGQIEHLDNDAAGHHILSPD
jgi:hypothetical protein